MASRSSIVDYRSIHSPAFRSYWLRVIVLALGLLSTVAARAGNTNAPAAEREAAVTQARAGDAAGGLALLQSLLRQYPDDARLLADTTIVAGWAGNDSLTLQLYGRPETPKDDPGVSEAAARAARNLKQYDLAIELYRHSEALAPERWLPRLGEAMVLADKGDYTPASALMQPLLREHREEKEVMLAQANLCRRQGDLACALAMYELRLDQSADDVETRCLLAETLSELGGASYALRLCDHRGASEEWRLSAAAAENVRWGEAYAPTHVQQQSESELALARLDGVIFDPYHRGRILSEGEWDLIASEIPERQRPYLTKACSPMQTIHRLLINLRNCHVKHNDVARRHRVDHYLAVLQR